MLLFPVLTPLVRPGDDVASVLSEALSDQQAVISEQDILVVSSKVLATAEGRIVDLSTMQVSDEARRYARLSGRSPEFCEAVLEETKKRSGKVVGTCPGAMLTELEPASRFGHAAPLDRAPRNERGASGEAARPHSRRASWTILTANAGLDQSNIAGGFAVGWPEDPVESARRLRRELEEHMRAISDQQAAVSTNDADRWSLPAHLAVIVSDSCCRPRRLGVTAFALAVSGLDPFAPQAGKPDLFGKPLRITTEAVADQLATAANVLMGNAGESIPAVIVRGHGLSLSEFEGWVPGIDREGDLFRNLA